MIGKAQSICPSVWDYKVRVCHVWRVHVCEGGVFACVSPMCTHICNGLKLSEKGDLLI